MEEFDVLLIDIARVNIETTRTKGLMPKIDKKNNNFSQY